MGTSSGRSCNKHSGEGTRRRECAAVQPPCHRCRWAAPPQYPHSQRRVTRHRHPTPERSFGRYKGASWVRRCTHLHLERLLVHALRPVGQHDVGVLPALVALAGQRGGVAHAGDEGAADAGAARDLLGSPAERSVSGERGRVKQGWGLARLAAAGPQQRRRQGDAARAAAAAARRSLALLALQHDVGSLVLGAGGGGDDAGHDHQLGHVRLGLQGSGHGFMWVHTSRARRCRVRCSRVVTGMSGGWGPAAAAAGLPRSLPSGNCESRVPATRAPAYVDPWALPLHTRPTLMSRMVTWGTRLRPVSPLYSSTCSGGRGRSREEAHYSHTPPSLICIQSHLAVGLLQPMLRRQQQQHQH